MTKYQYKFLYLPVVLNKPTEPRPPPLHNPLKAGGVIRFENKLPDC